MIFNILRMLGAEEKAEGGVTGTYPDGVPAMIDVTAARKRQGHSGYERDYGAGRKISNVPAGYA